MQFKVNIFIPAAVEMHIKVIRMYKIIFHDASPLNNDNIIIRIAKANLKMPFDLKMNKPLR